MSDIRSTSSKRSNKIKRELERLRREEELIKEKQRADAEAFVAKQRAEYLEHKLAISRVEAEAADSDEILSQEDDYRQDVTKSGLNQLAAAATVIEGVEDTLASNYLQDLSSINVNLASVAMVNSRSMLTTSSESKSVYVNEGLMHNNNSVVNTISSSMGSAFATLPSIISSSTYSNTSIVRTWVNGIVSLPSITNIVSSSIVPVITPTVTQHVQSNVNVSSLPVASNSSASNALASIDYHSQLMNALQLPKVEIAIYDGKPLTFWSFIRTFEDSVERHTTDEGTKLTRLLQYTTGDAHSAILSCTRMEKLEGYRKAKEILKKRFGSDYAVADAWKTKVMDRQAIKPNDALALRALSDDLRNCTYTLEGANMLGEINNQTALLKLMEKLPSYAQQRWKRSAVEIKNHGRAPNIYDVMSFIEGIAEEANDPVFGKLATKGNESKQENNYHKIKSGNQKAKPERNAVTSTVFSMQTDSKSEIATPHRASVCMKCGQAHKLYQCDAFKSLNMSDRYEFVQHHRLCRNCLGSNHTAYQCKLRYRCNVMDCGKKHSSLLHKDTIEPVQVQNHYVGANDNHVIQVTSTRKSLLVAPVIASYGQRSVSTYALLDYCSTDSFCSSELVEMLQLPPVTQTVDLTTLNGKRRNNVQKVNLCVSDMNHENTVLINGAMSNGNLPISNRVLALHEEIQKYAHLRDLPAYEVDKSKVTIIIGADTPSALVPLEVRSGDDGEPFAIRTKLGWGICGPVKSVADRNESYRAFVHFAEADQSLTLENMIENLWKVERKDDVYDLEECYSQEDRKVLQVYETARLENGHFTVAIPFKNDRNDLPNNKKLAEYRLSLLRKRLMREPPLATMYTTAMEKMFSAGHAEMINDNVMPSNGVWYLPHHAIMHPEKPNKVRVVFDCSATYQGTSLNKCVSQGPDYTNSMIGVLMRFRWQKMTCTFDAEDKAISVIHDVKEALKQGGFELKKWTTNKLEVQKLIPQEYQHNHASNTSTEHSLGILWNIESDELAYDVKIKNKPATKRGVLSIISSTYDPLGLLCPFVLKGKRIFQELTRKGVGWDDKLEDELVAWDKWKSELIQLRSFKVPRCVKSVSADNLDAVELHHFSDASSYAYGAATYIRLICKDGSIFCHLLLARSRLAPIKTMTVPRLELTAATVAVKLNAICMKEIEIPISSVTYWCDSMITLQYIRATNKRFKTFVANRVSVILDHSSPLQWFHISSEDNVADDLSRGLSAEQLINSDRWIVGPSFFYIENDVQSMKERSKSKLSDTPVCKDLEVAAEVAVFVSTTEGDEDELLKLIKRRSSWFALKKTVLWILRAVARFKKRINNQSAIVSSYTEEFQAAELCLLQYVQRKMFLCAVMTVQSDSKLTSDESGLGTLEPEFNENGLLCVGGRIAQNRRRQVILPRRHHVTELIVRECHERLGHAGHEHVIAVLRESYWILRARCVVKKVLRACVVCRRRGIKPCMQKMADLPTERITGDKPPFFRTGIDFFGPFNVKMLRSTVKRYCCLFTCLESRAVHIEVAEMLDTNSFINALRRFLCRRGPVELLWSDNGTNFVGAQSELKAAIEQWNQSELEQFCAQKEIIWRFNTPFAPHMGGVWERLIGSTKRIANVLLKEQTLTEETLRTVMCEIECILNSRPLTAVSDDPRDLNVITPSSLLTLRSSTLLPPGIFDKKDCYSRRRWKQVQYLAEEFWRRWRAEYIPSLQLRSKWRNIQQNLATGDVVLIVEENQPRNVWPLGRVIATYPSADGLVRSVDVCTKNGTYRRPIHKLCLLESNVA